MHANCFPFSRRLLSSAMNWQQVCEEPTLQDLPFKIELNEHGQVIMSPASNEHGRFQARLTILLTQHIPDGEVIAECSVETEQGVKVADVAWISAVFLAEHGYSTPYPRSPEICVEITSPSNSPQELQGKIALYFQRGAREVWICDSFGNLEFYGSAGELQESALLPEFPDRI
jgi:Uma2 family endonuclease